MNCENVLFIKIEIAFIQSILNLEPDDSQKLLKKIRVFPNYGVQKIGIAI